MRFALVALTALTLTPALAPPARAMDWTNPDAIRPILQATKANWVAVREFNGQDLLYFTHLFAWRCALSDIRYGVNGAPADTPVLMEDCYEDEAAPNAQKMTDMLPYYTYPLGSVDRVSVRIVYRDGSEDAAVFDRKGVQID